MAEDFGAQLTAQLEALQGTQFAPECLIDGVTLIMEASKSNAPVRTGNLRDSHSVEVNGDSVSIVVGAEYAGIVEYGTDSREPNPYLRPAMDDNAEEALKLIAQAVDNKIKEVVG